MAKKQVTVTVHRSMSGPAGTYKSGRDYEVDYDEAKRWEERGIATIKKTTAKKEKAVKEPDEKSSTAPSKSK